MFCSNCGKEVQEDMTYCSNCGWQLQSGSNNGLGNVQQQRREYVNQSNNNIELCPPDEKQKKSLAVFFYFISTFIGVFLIFSFLATKLEFLAKFIDTELPQDVFISALKNMYEEYGPFLWFAGIFYLSVPIVQGIVLGSMYKKRNFLLRLNNVILQSVMDSILWFIMPIFANILLTNHFNYEASVSVWFWMFAIMIALFKIAYAITYFKAAECEETNINNEKQKIARKNEQNAAECNGELYWICPNCRTSNSAKDMFCQKCGKNK